MVTLVMTLSTLLSAPGAAQQDWQIKDVEGDEKSIQTRGGRTLKKGSLFQVGDSILIIFGTEIELAPADTTAEGANARVILGNTRANRSILKNVDGIYMNTPQALFIVQG